MKVQLAGIAAALAVTVSAPHASAADWDAPPATPTAAAMGYAELGYGWLRFADDDADLRDITGAGYANIPLFPGWNFELEARGTAIKNTGQGSSSQWEQVGGFGHVYWRDPSRGALGAFGGYNAIGLFGNSGNHWTAGGEGLLYLANLTLLGQAGWESSDSNADYLDFEGYFARGAVRYFAGPNLRLQADVLWSALYNPSWDVDAERLTLVGTAEYRLPNVPLSGFASVRWDDVTGEGPASDLETTTILLGIRGYLGSGSLLDNDRNGAPFDVLPLAPTYYFNLG